MNATTCFSAINFSNDETAEKQFVIFQLKTIQEKLINSITSEMKNNQCDKNFIILSAKKQQKIVPYDEKRQQDNTNNCLPTVSNYYKLFMTYGQRSIIY